MLVDTNEETLGWKEVEKKLSVHEDLPMHKFLTVNTLDSGYASPEYIANTHEQKNSINIIRSAYWLLWVGQKEAGHDCRKRQQYDKNYKNRKEHNLKVTPSQVQLQMEAIILGFEQTPFLPKQQIKGKGRQLGDVQEKKPTYPILKKKRKKRKKKRL